MSEILLIHGGFYPAMTAERFWDAPGVTPALARAGHRVVAPDRTVTHTTWHDEALHLLRRMGDAAHVVAGSNGCSVAARLAIEHPGRVRSVVLCWPATAGDAQVDARSIEELLALGTDPSTARGLINAGNTLRGATDAELGALRVPVGIVATAPPDPAHQQITVDRLFANLADAQSLGAFPVPLHPAFAAHVDALATVISNFVAVQEHR